MEVWTTSPALTEDGQSETVLCLCVFSSVLWEFHCMGDEQCRRACVCVYVCPIEVLVSQSQSDPPPAGTVMPPTSPLPTLHLALH